MIEPPTGIIRTLPSLYADPANPGYRGLMESIQACEADEEEYFHIALAQQPKHELLHMYLLITGEIRYRFTLVGYRPGTVAKCWDESIRSPKVWAVCTGPIERPPHPIKQRGFQGFRYTETLW